MQIVDVAVVGGGPAGSAAAITLARAGLDVVVVDKARFPRDKCCGDGLTTGALRELERLGFSSRALPSWAPTGAAWVRSPSGRVVRFPLPEGRGTFAAVCRRTELDAALVELAAAAGAKVREDAEVVGVEQRAGAVVLDIDHGEPVLARHVVAADGMWSAVRRLSGCSTPGYLGDWHAFRQYWADVDDAAEQLWVWFDPDLLPGYAWSFPLGDGRANVGFGLLRGPGVDGARLRRVMAGLAERPHVRAVLGPAARPETPARAWPIPARIDRSVLAHGRILFAGDAAAATDPLTGEGIGQALLTGRLAAEAIIVAGTVTGGQGGDGRAAGAGYRRAARAHLVADHRMSLVLGRVLRSSWGARGAVRIAGATPWTRANFGRWLFEDEPRAVICTPRRWHRRFLDRDGARVD